MDFLTSQRPLAIWQPRDGALRILSRNAVECWELRKTDAPHKVIDRWTPAPGDDLLARTRELLGNDRLVVIRGEQLLPVPRRSPKAPLPALDMPTAIRVLRYHVYEPDQAIDPTAETTLLMRY